MKVKILAQLKKQFPGVSNNLLDKVASVLEKTVTKEEDIETAVNNAAGLVQEFSAFHQSEADRRVTEAVQKRETELRAELEKKEPKPGDANPDEVPPWAKAFIESNKVLTEKLAGLESANTQKSLSEKLVAALTEKKIPATFFNTAIQGKTFKDEAEMTSFAATIETAFNTFLQDSVNSGLMQQPAPVLGSQNKDVVSTVVQSFVESKKAESEGKAAPASSLGGKPL